MITHLTLNQSQIKCSVVAGQPRWDHAPCKQAIADRKCETQPTVEPSHHITIAL